jgi:hypothetical protein
MFYIRTHYVRARVMCARARQHWEIGQAIVSIGENTVQHWTNIGRTLDKSLIIHVQCLSLSLVILV